MYIIEAFPSTSDPKMAILPGFVQKVKCMHGMQQNETYDTYIHEKLQDPARKESTPQAHPASE